MKAFQQIIKQNRKLIPSIAIFFVLVTGLNFLNAADNIAFFWKIAGAVVVVVFIATLRVGKY